MSPTKAKQKAAQESGNAGNAGPVCMFCHHPNVQSIKFGKFIKLGETHVHYFCLLLSSGLSQNGLDSEGIYGFLIEDINKEHKRGEKLKCSYCRKSGATIGCAVKACKTMFHLPCGLDNQALCTLFDKFDCFCVKHRTRQALNGTVDKEMCAICYTDAQFDEGFDVLQTSCCAKLLHRVCVQKHALSSGYLFKCPLCNSVDGFKGAMLTQGIYVPKQDASWEREDHAYDELYEHYSRCDQDICLCPRGRNHRGDSREWQLLICDSCGSKGMHWSCLARTEYVGAWNCQDCLKVADRIQMKGILGTDRQTLASNATPNGAVNRNYLAPTSTVTTSSINRSPVRRRAANDVMARRTNYQLSANQSIEIQIESDDESLSAPSLPKRVRRLANSGHNHNKVETKDIAIQCELVNADDLIECEPIERMEAYVVKTPIVPRITNGFNANDVIELDDSDDDIVLLD